MPKLTVSGRMPVGTVKACCWREQIRQRWQALLHDLSNPYRPELHYMRGPGPKWHAKQQSAALPRN